MRNVAWRAEQGCVSDDDDPLDDVWVVNGPEAVNDPEDDIEVTMQELNKGLGDPVTHVAVRGR